MYCDDIIFEIINKMSLLKYHTENVLEMGVDEAGRGPIFGRVYAAAVIWPKDLETNLVKDSKKYKKAEERQTAYDYIMDNCVGYGIGFVEAEEIDKINIYQAVIKSMHMAINDTNINVDHILVDGNSFKPYEDQHGEYTSYTTVIGGDDKYLSIAAASVLAKVEHDLYIKEMCDQYPLLNIYDLRKNNGYGTAKHLDAIKEHGISQFHRKSFKCCANLTIKKV